MQINMSEELLTYLSSKKCNTLTVDAVVSKGTCCRVLVAKVSLGKPKKASNTYDIHEASGIEIHISTKLKLEDTLSFSYSKLLNLHRIECTGYEIERTASLF